MHIYLHGALYIIFKKQQTVTLADAAESKNGLSLEQIEEEIEEEIDTDLGTLNVDLGI